MAYFVQPDHRLHYRERGDGPLLLLFPGNTASSACHAVVAADNDLLLRMAAQGCDPFAGRLAAATCPTLITASLADDLLPPGVGPQLCSLAQALPNASLFLMGEGGHPLMWSRPEAFRAISLTFLRHMWSNDRSW